MHDIRTDHTLCVTLPTGTVTCVPGCRPVVLSLVSAQRMRWAQGAA